MPVKFSLLAYKSCYRLESSLSPGVRHVEILFPLLTSFSLQMADRFLQHSSFSLVSTILCLLIGFYNTLLLHWLLQHSASSSVELESRAWLLSFKISNLNCQINLQVASLPPFTCGHLHRLQQRRKIHPWDAQAEKKWTSPLPKIALPRKALFGLGAFRGLRSLHW